MILTHTTVSHFKKNSFWIISWADQLDIKQDVVVTTNIYLISYASLYNYVYTQYDANCSFIHHSTILPWMLLEKTQILWAWEHYPLPILSCLEPSTHNYRSHYDYGKNKATNVGPLDLHICPVGYPSASIATRRSSPSYIAPTPASLRLYLDMTNNLWRNITGIW